MIYPEFWGRCVEVLPGGWSVVQPDDPAKTQVRTRLSLAARRARVKVCPGDAVRVALDEHSGVGLILRATRG